MMDIALAASKRCLRPACGGAEKVPCPDEDGACGGIYLCPIHDAEHLARAGFGGQRGRCASCGKTPRSALASDGRCFACRASSALVSRHRDGHTDEPSGVRP